MLMRMQRRKLQTQNPGKSDKKKSKRNNDYDDGASVAKSPPGQGKDSNIALATKVHGIRKTKITHYNPLLQKKVVPIESSQLPKNITERNQLRHNKIPSILGYVKLRQGRLVLANGEPTDSAPVKYPSSTNTSVLSTSGVE